MDAIRKNVTGEIPQQQILAVPHTTNFEAGGI
jgi:hypothetical protein